ncbi:LysR family transcriptional regulator [Massilia atriviolacea]|uniref:LysR family transcriptional regulator n=1 Tax=Massilia atriviolacea TaxID=2495579 RepID=A0A430HIG5_9BURK|nr:LysR family transcriptional regulator [Massilia atriviolacea]RSZ57295.1 LysR family transcriptional regulator [Massilia atriviolacea]
MADTSFDGLRAFLTVAELKSFTAAAARLGVTTTAVSKAVKLLEERHGAILLQRTTRNVALTEAGAALFATLRGAVDQIDQAFAALHAANGRPSGTLRLTMPRALGALQIAALAERFRQRCPDVTLDIALDDGAVDLVAAGFDAGIRLGQALAQDMVAVRLTPELRWSVLGSPDYLARAGRPATPEALAGHQTLRYRFPGSGALPRWSFVRDGQAFQVDTGGAVIVNDTTLIRQFALAGMGLAYLPDMEAGADIDAGRLERVLASFVPPTSGLFLYFPVRTQHQPKLRAFIDLAREHAHAGGVPD